MLGFCVKCLILRGIYVNFSFDFLRIYAYNKT